MHAAGDGALGMVDFKEFAEPALYVINLDDSTERLSKISEQLERLNLDFTRVSGVDGREMALLHKSADGRGSPFPGQTYPTGSVTGMPSAV